MASSLSSSSSFRGVPLVAGCAQVKASPVRVAVGPCRCHIVKDENVLVQRRHALAALLTASAAFSIRISPALAVYGEAANVFGSRKKETGFLPVSKDGFEIEVPAKWNPSREAEYPGTVLRYEDNFDANSNLAVMITPTTKSSIKDYGSPEEFLNSVSYLFGRQSYGGKTKSEGGFEANAVASASVLETSAPVIKGKDYYNISVLTRTADGDEGGKHQVIVGTVSDGKLYLLKIQAGDKRWFKGAKKFVEGTANSFTVALTPPDKGIYM